MKKTLVSLMASVVLVAPMVGHTQDFTPEQQAQAQLCMAQSVIAKRTMIYRQQGLKKTETQKKLKAEYIKPDSSKEFSTAMNTMFNGLIAIAYKEPIAKTEAEKDKVSSEFFWDVAKACMEKAGLDIGNGE